MACSLRPLRLLFLAVGLLIHDAAAFQLGSAPFSALAQGRAARSVTSHARRLNAASPPTLRQTTNTGLCSVRASVSTESLADMIEAAEPGDTILLGKGTYDLGGAMLTLDKEITIAAEPGVDRDEVLITGTAPTDARGMMFMVTSKVTIRGVHIHHAGGSVGGTLSSGVGSICIFVNEPGKLELEEVKITTETSTALLCSGQQAAVEVNTCRVGPCGWDVESSAGYGICIFRGAHGTVYNTDVWRVGQSGIIAFYEGSSALCVDCDVGPCQLGGIAAEGQRAELRAKRVHLHDIEWKQVAEYDGGEVVFLDDDDK